MKNERKLASLTLDEKIKLVSGHNFMYTNGIDRLGIPSVAMADGPHGLRKQIEKGALDGERSEPATAFPTAAATACSWDTALLSEIGAAMGTEARALGVDIILGPGTNIKRNALCGRGFEYFSEDPLLAGKLSAAMIGGVSSKGVMTSLKHFALNSSENYRFMGDSVADMRAIREIYLKPFEIAVKESKPATLMCAYNKINGVYCSENEWLLSQVLRSEWGFEGAVMTDWGATHDRVEGIKAGLDLEMPGDTRAVRRQIRRAVKKGELPVEALDAAAQRVLGLCDKINGKSGCFDPEAHNALAARAAAESAVLLKNESVLPLSKDESITVIGDLFAKMRYQGAGSSLINPTKLLTSADAFHKNGVNFSYFRGYSASALGDSSLEQDNELLNEALGNVNNSSHIVLFLGLTDFAESEAMDRENMRLPDNQLRLVSAIVERVSDPSHISVILFGGDPVELPFADKVGAILTMHLPGQAGGDAVYRLLFGEENPSGRLAQSWYEEYSDLPFGADFGKTRRELYRESIFVGYRNSALRLRYPFGYGLSYTEFEYSDASIAADGESATVSVTLTNTGERDGAEVVQLYSRLTKSEVFRPERELRAFKKVFVPRGESVRVSLSVFADELAFFNTGEGRFVTEAGEYELILARHSRDDGIVLNARFDGESVASPYTERVSDIYSRLDFDSVTDDVFSELCGFDIPRAESYPLTLESPLEDLRSTALGRALHSLIMSVPKRRLRRAAKMPEGEQRDHAIKGALFLERIFRTNSLRSMSMSSGGLLPLPLAAFIIRLAGGRVREK